MATHSGKVISICSVKGGVGKTTMAINLSGLYFMMKKKVLLLDLDLYSGGIAVSLDINNKKDVYMLVDSLNNNRFTTLSDYVVQYNKGIDVLAAPRDPRNANKISHKYITTILELAKKEYDVILVDTSHVLDEVNLTILDNSYCSLYVITNDLVDLKNMKSLVSIFKDAGKSNYLTLLNNSRDTGKDFLSLFDIKNIIKTNVDYTISRNFYIKNIDKYVLEGQILTLNNSILRFHNNDIENMKKACEHLISNQ